MWLDLPRMFVGASKALRMFIPKFSCYVCMSYRCLLRVVVDGGERAMQLTDRNKRNKMNLHVPVCVRVFGVLFSEIA